MATTRNFNPAAWIDAVDAIPGVTIYVGKHHDGRFGFGVLWGDNADRYRELEAELWVAGDNRERLEAVKAELVRRGRVVGPHHD